MKSLFLSTGLLVVFAATLTSCFRNEKENQEVVPVVSTVPAVHDVVMYEVFVRNFTAEGTFTAIIPHLDRLKELGVNVLWFMPIQPTGQINKKGTYGSPYSISDFTEVHPDYGTKADFRRLVDSIHAKGMYIIIDEVANHTAWDCRWITEHPEWYTQDSTGKIVVPIGTDWSDVADLNYDNAELRKEKIRGLKYWIDSFNIDGYRCDVAGWVPEDFWKECITALRQSRPILMLAEGNEAKLYEAGFEITYGWDLYHSLKKLWNGTGTTATIDSTLKREAASLPAHYRHIRFITNHDENSWDDVPQNKFVNAQGAQAAFIASLTLPGVPFIYNGQETGYPTRINLFEKYTIDWSAHPELQQWYSRVVGFYNGNDVLKKGTIEQLNLDNKTTLIYERKLPEEKSLWVIINTQNAEITAMLPSPLQNKKLVDLLSKEELATEADMKLRPYQYHVVTVQ